MVQEGFKRKLTAILSADVAGYSRLMGLDEESTIRTLTNYRSAMARLIQQHRGRVVDAPGDNILAEFASVVEAVNCGVEIQRELAERNAALPEERKMLFRIGINLGDVVDEENRIYGAVTALGHKAIFPVLYTLSLTASSVKSSCPRS
jgi:class 3 adenylate cyclase